MKKHLFFLSFLTFSTLALSSPDLVLKPPKQAVLTVNVFTDRGVKIACSDPNISIKVNNQTIQGACFKGSVNVGLQQIWTDQSYTYSSAQMVVNVKRDTTINLIVQQSEWD
jgi:hypothetical protein